MSQKWVNRPLKSRVSRCRIYDLLVPAHQDGIMEKRDALIAALERRMAKLTEVQPLFTIRWGVV